MNPSGVQSWLIAESQDSHLLGSVSPAARADNRGVGDGTARGELLARMGEPVSVLGLPKLGKILPRAGNSVLTHVVCSMDVSASCRLSALTWPEQLFPRAAGWHHAGGVAEVSILSCLGWSGGV